MSLQFPKSPKGNAKEPSPAAILGSALSERLKCPAARMLANNLPLETKRLLLDNQGDLKLAKETINRIFPRLAALTNFQDEFLTEVIKAVREDRKAEAVSHKQKSETAVGELVQMSRIHSLLEGIRDRQKHGQFLKWYTALSLEQRSYFHLVASSLGNSVLAELMQSNLGELDSMVNSAAADAEEEKREESYSSLQAQVQRDPRLKEKVGSYLQHLGSAKERDFWKAAQERLQGDAKQLDFLLEMPYEHVDNYLGMSNFDPWPQWLKNLFS